MKEGRDAAAIPARERWRGWEGERGLTRDINKTGWMNGTRYNLINSGWKSNKREVEGLVWGRRKFISIQVRSQIFEKYI